MTSEIKTISEQLGSAVSGMARTALDPEVRNKAASCLLDAVGLAWAARTEATVQSSLLVHKATGSAGEVSIWATGEHASWGDACLLNGIAAHGHFQDDCEPSSWCHPGSLVLPAVIAAVELDDGSVDDSLRGIAAGYAVLHWLGASQQFAHALIGQGFRTSPVLGAIGAAAGAAAALRLPADKCAHAIAIATSLTGGTLAPLKQGSDEWRIQNGNAARTGLMAALCARQGVQGALGSIEGAYGLLSSFTRLDKAPDEWSKPFDERAIVHSYVKPWATLGDNMAAVRTARVLFEQGLDASQIESGEITIWHKYAEYPGTAYKGPFDRPIQALASTAYCTSAMLLTGELDYDVSLHGRTDPATLDLVNRLRVSGTRQGTKLDARIILTMKDGSKREARAAQAPSEWLYPDRKRTTAIFTRRLQALLESARAQDLADKAYHASAENGSLRAWLASLHETTHQLTTI